MYLAIAFLCLATVPGSFCYEDIHEYMSREELQRVFHTDAVPEYEIVKLDFPERLHKRDLPSGSHFHMKAFGEDINLWLHPRDSILAGVDTPVYYAKYSQSKIGGVEYIRRAGLMGMIGKIFEDPSKMASLVIGTEETGRARVNGFIDSKGMVIKPLPERVAKEYRRRRSIDDLEDSSYHIVFKTNDDLAEAYSLPPVNETKLRQRVSGSDTGVPDTLYPEILVIVDNSVYTTFDTQHGHDIYGLLEYLLAFWNSVDLRYRSLETPRFRLNIAGIVLSEDVEATPYLAQQMESKTAFNSTYALPGFRYFLYKVRETFPLDSYDVAVTMTRHDFGLGVWTTVAGLAVVGTICKIDHDYQTFEAVSIFKDNGAFQGVHFVAHELGHVFGAHHDHESANCPTRNGFIMAFTPWYTTNSSDFSPCSMNEFQATLDDGKYTCLYNKPRNAGETLPKIMPGRMMDLREQCRKAGMQEPCRDPSVTDSVCVNYYCLGSNGQCRESQTAALDGTACEGENKFCLHQQCVSL